MNPIANPESTTALEADGAQSSGGEGGGRVASGARAAGRSPDAAPYRTAGRVARRIAVLGPTLGTTLAAGWAMLGVVAAGGVTPLEALIVALFVPTIAGIVLPFWSALAGAALLLTGRHPVTLEPVVEGASGAPLPTGSRTALVMPVHEEEVGAVEARLSAMAGALVEAGAAAAFDVHLLSDSVDPETARREEAAHARLVRRYPDIAIHYRRRLRRSGRKAGNVAEFTGRCRDEYDFMVVLDADSLMGASTLLRMVARMEADPRLGLLQAPPSATRALSLFGRAVRFASELYGPVLSAGTAFWWADGGNYWGHNAIVRMRAFADEARLPVLPGRAPLGGEILSHDFVEAALLRRAGWRVVFDPTLEDSWEEVPPDLDAWSVRDRRWAQGSLQHLRLLGRRDLPLLSRLHFVLGAAAYLSSLFWFLLLIAGTAYVFVPALGSGGVGVGIGTVPGVSLLGWTAFVLFTPRLLGIALALLRHRAEFGGGLRLAAGAALETALSVVTAPLLMVWNAGGVTRILAGQAVGWGAQPRSADGLTWRSALRRGGGPTALGLTWTAATAWLAPSFLIWLAPILVGLLLGVPLVRWTASARLGGWFAERGLLVGPSERRPTAVVGRMEADLASIPARLNEPSGRSGVSGLPSLDSATVASDFGGTMYNAERGLFDLKRGRPLFVDGSSGDVPLDDASGWLVAPVEGLDAARLAAFRALGMGTPMRLVVTGHRARAMQWTAAGVTSESTAWALPLADDTSVDEIVRLASDPMARLNGRRRLVVPAEGCEAAGLSLAHLGRLLPAVVTVAIDPVRASGVGEAVRIGGVLRATCSDVREFIAGEGTQLERISEAPVPVPQDDDSRFILFREPHGLREHVAVLVGDPSRWPDPVPVRLHSACFTGDLFGSLRCDCGEQLGAAMDHFAERGGGVLLYLAQEGRGIGLGNKFRAYTIQGSGFDTIDADGTLGFGADERRYDVAVGMLRDIGVERIELLTNNPEKLGALEAAGIEVVRRRPLHGRLNRHNLPYMEAKARRAGHWLDTMLGEPIAGD